jgi:hypothetical protein
MKQRVAGPVEMPWGGLSYRHGRRDAFKPRPSSEEAVSEIFPKSRSTGRFAPFPTGGLRLDLLGEASIQVCGGSQSQPDQVSELSTADKTELVTKSTATVGQPLRIGAMALL